MKRPILGGLTVLAILVLTSIGQVSAQSTGLPVSLGGNPGIFQKFQVPVSSMNYFLASDAGQMVLLHSPHPLAQALLTRYFGSTVASQWPQKPLLKSPSGPSPSVPVVTGCGTASGTQFDLEPANDAVPQNEPPVDFLPNRLGSSLDMIVQNANDFRGFFGGLGFSISGVYVHRSTATACSPDLEFGNPQIPDPIHAGLFLFGFGDTHVTADPIRDQFIYSDLRFGAAAGGVGLRRTPASNFLSTSTCPSGTESPGAAITCAGATAVVLGASEEDAPDFPQSTQDPRSGTAKGAGDVYASWTNFDIGAFEFNTEIELAVCKATFTSLADCSTPEVVSDPDVSVQFSSLSVVPAGPSAGKVTLSYVNFVAGAVCSPAFFCQQIKVVVCTPNGAPAAPTCAPAVVAETEKQPIPGLGLTNIQTGGFRTTTIPVIVNRADPTPATATGQTTFLFWERCGAAKTLTSFLPPFSSGLECPNADILMATSTSLTTFGAPTALDASVGTHEFMPAATVDQNQNITKVAYYHTPDTNTYKNRTQVLLKQIPSGSTTPGAAIVITSVPDSPAGDANSPFFAPAYGDYIGISARGTGGVGGSRAYIGHTNDSRLGIYGTSTNTESNNHVSKVVY